MEETIVVKWDVVIFGEKGHDEDFEISVVREDDTHGHESWGWFSDTKLLISHDGNCSGLTEKVWDKMVKLAHEVADELNATNV